MDSGDASQTQMSSSGPLKQSTPSRERSSLADWVATTQCPICAHQQPITQSSMPLSPHPLGAGLAINHPPENHPHSRAPPQIPVSIKMQLASNQNRSSVMDALYERVKTFCHMHVHPSQKNVLAAFRDSRGLGVPPMSNVSHPQVAPAACASQTSSPLPSPPSHANSARHNRSVWSQAQLPPDTAHVPLQTSR